SVAHGNLYDVMIVGRGVRHAHSSSQLFADDEDGTVDGEKDGCGEGLGKQGAKTVLEKKYDDDDRDGGHDEQPRHAFVGVLDAPVAARREETSDDSRPVL